VPEKSLTSKIALSQSAFMDSDSPAEDAKCTRRWEKSRASPSEAYATLEYDQTTV
jgi:hypothetical protein